MKREIRPDEDVNKSDMIYDMLNLVEAYYKPRLKYANPDRKQELVLDAELFTREARYYTKSEAGKRYQSAYTKAMAAMLEEGRPIEIIDGDTDKLEKDSLLEMMKFI